MSKEYVNILIMILRKVNVKRMSFLFHLVMNDVYYISHLWDEAQSFNVDYYILSTNV